MKAITLIYQLKIKCKISLEISQAKVMEILTQKGNFTSYQLRILIQQLFHF